MPGHARRAVPRRKPLLNLPSVAPVFTALLTHVGCIDPSSLSVAMSQPDLAAPDLASTFADAAPADFATDLRQLDLAVPPDLRPPPAANVVFGAPVAYDVQAKPFAVTTADLNSDGHPDVAVANRNGNSASVLLGRGDGTLKS